MTGSATTKLPSIGPAPGTFTCFSPAAQPRSSTWVSAVRRTSPALSPCRRPTITCVFQRRPGPERTEAAVFDPNTGVFTILGPTGVSTGVGRVPELAISRPRPTTWATARLSRLSSGPAPASSSTAGGTVIATFGAGASTDIPWPHHCRIGCPPSATTGTGGGTTGSGGSSGTGGGTGPPAPGRRHRHRHNRHWHRDDGHRFEQFVRAGFDDNDNHDHDHDVDQHRSPLPRSVTIKKKKSKKVVVPKKVTKPAKPKKVEKKVAKPSPRWSHPAKKVVKM